MTIITWYSNLKARNPNHWTTTDVFVHDTCIPKSEFDFSWNDRIMMTKPLGIWYIHVSICGWCQKDVYAYTSFCGRGFLYSNFANREQYRSVGDAE